jgi:hypothetical protein
MGVLGESADTPDPEEQKDDAEQVVADVEKTTPNRSWRT